ncbi:hypothetical protein [Christiangramia forsetii]|nr:hypothetical protein [Christiangramia forsetii]GGG23168.1 hypothetical protein GCM10011532_02860 [Christiangramia forsetii]
MKRYFCFLGLAFCLFTVSCNNSNAIPIADNTFVLNEKVYKVIDNEITELANLNNDSISKSEVLNPNLKSYGETSLGYVKYGASAELKAVYRGDQLFFKLRLDGINDLRSSYSGGGFSINLTDEYDFQLHTIPVDKNEMIAVVDENGDPTYFEYNGKAQMSSEVYKAIKDFSVSSYLRKGY